MAQGPGSLIFIGSKKQKIPEIHLMIYNRDMLWKKG